MCNLRHIFIYVDSEYFYTWFLVKYPLIESLAAVPVRTDLLTLLAKSRARPRERPQDD
jgi:hypothetical protein